MFTQMTQNFGAWKKSHRNRNIYYVGKLNGVLVALAMAAFVSWIGYLLLVKIRSEFFSIPSYPLQLHSIKKVPNLMPARASTFTVGLLPRKNGQGMSILFDTGEKILYPEQAQKIRDLIRARTKEIEYLTMLTKTHPGKVGRIQIWPHKDVNFFQITDITNFFVQEGFDDFDIAVKVETSP